MTLTGLRLTLDLGSYDQRSSDWFVLLKICRWRLAMHTLRKPRLRIGSFACQTFGIAMAMSSLIGSIGAGCSTELTDSRPVGSVSSVLSSEPEAQGLANPDLEALAFSGEIDYKPVGNHTNRFTIRSGPHDHAFGHGFALSIKEVTAFGACTKHTVFDFESQTLSWVDGYGYPTCPNPSRTLPEPHVLRVNDPGFRDQLNNVVTFLDTVLKDPRSSEEDKNKILIIYKHLWSKVYPG